MILILFITFFEPLIVNIIHYFFWPLIDNIIHYFVALISKGLIASRSNGKLTFLAIVELCFENCEGYATLFLNNIDQTVQPL